ncbi:hypothetical protein GCM10009119_16400 [Algoriphagus jejuensis]|uniref:DUF4136 domain-containing protein n=1 Tax=Algoriphagus jejuensis TaxID=419934 RepID=A0ABN1MZH5_9BACT
MKNLLLVAGLLGFLVSCKSSENFSVDQVSKSSGLEGLRTYQVISQDDAPKNIIHVNQIFEKSLMDEGFTPVSENPDLLVQAVISSVQFEKEVVGFSSSVGLTDNSAYSPVKKETGEYGKVIFLIQDAKTNEVLWMGTGTGILSENGLIAKKDIQNALDNLIADLR